MKAFFVDFKVEGGGILTSYVEANTVDSAREAIMNYVSTNDGVVDVAGEEKRFIDVDRVYEIDEIPCDCSYLNEDGRFMSAKADQPITKP